MPFARPTLTALRNEAIQDITTSGVPGLDGLLRNSVLRVLSWVMSGLAYSVYGYLDWIARQSVPFTATDEYLYAWAALVGIYQKDSTPAPGSAQFTGTAGLPLSSGAALTRQDGTPYTTTADGTVDDAGGSDGAHRRRRQRRRDERRRRCCDLDRLPGDGDQFGRRDRLAVDRGADQETTDALRTRMLFRYAEPPQGGSTSDYIAWALEVPGVTRAWVQPGGGSVQVYPMFDVANAADGGFPQGSDGCASEETRGPPATGDQLTVAEHIWPLQPVTALVFVAAPVPAPIDITLANLNPATADMEADILASLQDAFLAISEVAGTIYPSQLYQAILATPGVIYFDMTSPAAPVTAPAGALPTMGNLSVV